MKNLFFLFMLNIVAMVQVMGQPEEVAINAISLEITYNKTTSLIFPASIKNVDRGSRDILAQKARDVNNILQLKANKSNFPETNLTVITGDGLLYHFMVNYIDHPKTLVFEIGKHDREFSSRAQFKSNISESKLSELSKSIVGLNTKGRMAGSSKHGISLSLNGVYIRDNTIFYLLSIKNRSSIDYDPDFLKFYVRDMKQFKRTATQEAEVKPLHVHGDGSSIKAGSENTLVYAFEKFTVPDTRHLMLELFESNGGRHLNLSVKSRMIIKAKAVPEQSIYHL